MECADWTAGWKRSIQIVPHQIGGARPHEESTRKVDRGIRWRESAQAPRLERCASGDQRKGPSTRKILGSIRRECLDHILPLGESHLRRVLGRYAEYCSSARCHLSLDGNAPEPREVESGPRRVRAIEHLGGLHHRYTRAA